MFVLFRYCKKQRCAKKCSRPEDDDDEENFSEAQDDEGTFSETFRIIVDLVLRDMYIVQ